jgi:hypothetical protein
MLRDLKTTGLLAIALTLGTPSAMAAVFTGSLYMLNNTGNPAFDNTAQCASCNPLIGEIDNNLMSFVDMTAGTGADIIGNSPLLDTGLNWSLTNLAFVENADTTISVSGNFLWTNYAGLTTSTFTQLFDTLGPNGELIALDGDNDSIVGNVLIDGPYQGYTLYLDGNISSVPVPAAAWLFGSGLLALLGLSRRSLV